MKLRKIVASGVVVVASVGSAVAAYQTRDHWMEVVFPKASTAVVTESHSEGGCCATAPPESGHSHAEAVHLSTQAIDNLKLEVEAIVPRVYFRSMQIPGMVVDRPGESDRGVAARVAGIVNVVKARPGDTVRAGDHLFTIQLVSEFVQSTQTELAKSSRELKFAQAKRERTAELVKIGTLSQGDQIEADQQVSRFTTQVDSYKRQLQTFGLTPTQIADAMNGQIITEVTVNVPVENSHGGHADPKAVSEGLHPPVVYEVQDLKVHLGEHVQAGQILATLSNHQELFIEGRAFKSEAKGLAEAAKQNWDVIAEFADEKTGDWPDLGPLHIQHLSNSVDPTSRTFSFFVPLKNQSEVYTKGGKTYFVWRFRPGQRVLLNVNIERVRFDRSNDADLVFVLPTAAVVREGGEAYVFKQNGDLFQRLKVRVLHEDREVIVLANDDSIRGGQPIVRNQAAALNRAMKANVGGGEHEHCHDH